jgi:threonine dehydrogenase-like Zn-dependent dehydrogenase
VRALTWHGKQDVRVEDVPDPRIEVATDAIIRVTSTAICGSDLHLYEVLGPFLDEGDVLGHEPMGIVEEVGPGVHSLKRGDRVVVPFNVSCGQCWMCSRGLYAQCETTQNRDHGTGASLFGYTELYGSVPGGQAEYLRVPYADVGPIVVPEGPPDERFLFLSDVIPTAWQAVAYADVPRGGTLGVIGLGPIGQMCVRVAPHFGIEEVIAVDRISERLSMAQRYGAATIDLGDCDDVGEAMRELTGGRGPDSVVDAVGMEAHASPVNQALHKVVGLLPDAVAKPMMKTAGTDRLAALYTSIDSVRRGGTVSLSGVYGGGADPMPMLQMFDKGIQLRMGQCHVRRWTDDVVPLAMDDADPLGTMDLVTHRAPLDQAPELYDLFQRKADGCIKVVLQP